MPQFLTFPARVRQFLTFGVWISHFLHAGTLNFSLFARRQVERWSAGARQPIHNMVLATSLGGPAWEWAGRRHEKGRPACDWAGRRASVAGWKSEKSDGKVRISQEKWPKVRNSNQKVRNSRVHAGKWEIQTLKWEIRASAHEKWEIQTKSENQIIIIFVKVRNSRE